MTYPRDESAEPKLGKETMTTGLQGLRQIEGLGGQVEPMPEVDPPVYVKEPLFSKKVMLAWAAGAFIVWFAFSFIVPEIVEEVKESIVSSMEQSGSNTATKTVIRTKNGITITRTERGITIDRPGLPPQPAEPLKPGVPAPTAPAAPPAAADAKKAAELQPRR